MQYAIFGLAPDTVFYSSHDTPSEALAALNTREVEVKQDWTAIIPCSHIMLTETFKETGSAKCKGDYAEALAILDLRPSELEALAKEIAETSEADDHILIEAIKDAYLGNTGEEMACPYP